MGRLELSFVKDLGDTTCGMLHVNILRKYTIYGIMYMDEYIVVR